MDPSKIRKKIGLFRILIIGRANAGKTTILQRVCNTQKNPEIFNCTGEKIDPAVLKASRERGEHNIENEMVFRSNPGFVFHDSRGFEAGGESEFEKVRAFIAGRSKETRLKNQLHVIWYCIPMDEASRSFTEGEIKFFSQCDTGSIPVMILFTKFDALYDVEFAQLRKKGTPWKDAKELAPKRAEESFTNGPQLKFLKGVPWPPKCHVCLPNMDKNDADCGPLIERTARILEDSEVLVQLFISTQQTNLQLCMKYAVDKTLPALFDSAETTASEGQEKMIGELGAWFPHLMMYYGYYDDDDADDADDAAVDFDIDYFDREGLSRSHCAAIRSRLLSVTSDSSRLENDFQLITAAVIVFEQSFYIFDKRRYLQDQQESDPSFYVAVEQYMASPHAVAVRKGVSAAIQAYEEAMTTAAHAYEEAARTTIYARQGNLTTLMAKLPSQRFKRKAKEAFERSQEAKQSFELSKKKEKEYLCSQAKAELTRSILEITLKHRLSRH